MLKLSRTHVAALIAGLLLAAVAPAAEPAAGKVNLNTATAEQLQLLPGVGPALAERVVEHRKQNGPFKAIEDLLLVRGIGEASFERMKPYLSIAGDTTLRAKVRLPRASRSENRAAK